MSRANISSRPESVITFSLTIPVSLSCECLLECDGDLLRQFPDCHLVVGLGERRLAIAVALLVRDVERDDRRLELRLVFPVLIERTGEYGAFRRPDQLA